MSDKATPRPWVVNGVGGDFRTVMILPSGVLVSARTQPGDDIENARLIVAAVNQYDAHKQAVEALRELLEVSTDKHAVECAVAALAAVDEASK